MSDRNLLDNKKDAILYFASFMKWNYNGITTNGISYQGKQYFNFEGCMSDRLASTFADDGNPVPEMQYIADCPKSFWWDVAYCLWDQLF